LVHEDTDTGPLRNPGLPAHSPKPTRWRIRNRAATLGAYCLLIITPSRAVSRTWS